MLITPPSKRRGDRHVAHHGELDTYFTWSFQASGRYVALTKLTFVANLRVNLFDRSDTL